LSGNYKPKSQEHISKIAARYPEIYEVLGATRDLPDIALRASSALDEIRSTLEKSGVDLESPEAERITIEIMERFGFKYVETKDAD
jgi:hypothetical protein